MLGDSLFSIGQTVTSFEGSDVNASAMGSGEGSGSGQGGYNNYQGGPEQAMSGNDNPNVDPAQEAARSAENSANATTQDANAQKTAASVNMTNWGGNSLMAGLFMAFDSKAKKVARKQRVLARAQAQAAIDNATRARDQYAQDSERQRQGLQQSYAGRGIGESSIQQEGMQYFNDTARRKAAELDQNINLAAMGRELTMSQISAAYAQPYMHIIGGILNMV